MQTKSVLQFPGDADREMQPVPNEAGITLHLVHTPERKVKNKKKPQPPTQSMAFNGKLFSFDIIEKREREDLTQRVAAKQMKISPSAVHDMEAYQSCNIKRLHTVCNWLGKPIMRYFSLAKPKSNGRPKKG